MEYCRYVMKSTGWHRVAAPISALNLSTCFAFATAIFVQFSLSVAPLVAAEKGVTTHVFSGGVGRFNSQSWGLVRGTFSNRSDSDQTVTAIVTPTATPNARYLRSVVVPANCVRRSLWPVHIGDERRDAFEFNVAVLDGDEKSTALKRNQFGESLQDFQSVNVPKLSRKNSGTNYSAGWCGILLSKEDSADRLMQDAIFEFSGVCRERAGLRRMTTPFTAAEIGGYTEGLDPLEQLLISARNLERSPEACEAIRSWVQRGGDAIIFATECGELSWRALVGDAAPATIVDETRPMNLQLQNAGHPQSSNEKPMMHERSFEEPVSLLRTHFESGHTLWTANEWPAVTEVTFGNGRFFVVTVSPTVLLDATRDTKLDPTGELLQDAAFKRGDKQLILTEELAQSAETAIGYEIPGRSFATVVLCVFTMLLGGVSWLFWKQQQSERMVLGVVGLSIVAAIPGLFVGIQSRQIAPPTLIESCLINATSGQSVLSADGVTTMYLPTPSNEDLKFSNMSLTGQALNSEDEGQRLVWTDRGESRWMGHSQPAGSTSYVQRTAVRLKLPLSATATLNADGVRIQLTNAEHLKPQEPILASFGPDRMAVRQISDGFQSSPTDVLAPGQYSKEALLSESQILRGNLYTSMFQNTRIGDGFPKRPSLLFWSEQLEAGVSLSNDDLRKLSQAMLSVPLDLQKPPINESICIPPVLIPYRPIADINGGISSAYSARTGTWVRKKTGSITVLKFDLPRAVQPFQFADCDLELRIFAGSRSVRIQTGPLKNQSDVTTLQSPLGNVSVPISAEDLNKDSTGEHVILKLTVSNLEGASGDSQLNAEQDDFWMIERVLLTLYGHRKAVRDSQQ